MATSIARRDHRAVTGAERRKSCDGQMNVWLRREHSHSSHFQIFDWPEPDFALGIWDLGFGMLPSVRPIKPPDDVVQRRGFGGHRQELDAGFIVGLTARNKAGAGDAEELDVRLSLDIHRENPDDSSGEWLGGFEMTAGTAHVTDTDPLAPDENRAAWRGAMRWHQ
jgi:hypothetical protein